MKKSYLTFIVSFLIIFGLNVNISAQDIKKDKDTKQTAKVQQTLPVSIFQVHFSEVNDQLRQLLTKNETVLHFRQEGDTGTFILYLPEGNARTDLTNLLDSNGIDEFEILVDQQGSRKSNLFNKRF